MSILFVMKTRR